VFIGIYHREHTEHTRAPFGKSRILLMLLMLVLIYTIGL